MIPVYVDRNVGPSAYAELHPYKLLVSHVFHTFQGEGPCLGYPALFVRLAGCNLGDKQACPWCDADFRIDHGIVFSCENLAQRIAAERHRIELVVFTGGEPLLQADALLYCIDKLGLPGIAWHFETNGVLLKDDHFMLALQRLVGSRHLVVVSPKIIDGRYRPLPAVLHRYRFNMALKIIVSGDPTSPYHHLPPDLDKFADYCPIYLSGQTEYGDEEDRVTRPGAPASLLELSYRARKQTATNYAYAARLALEHGYRVTFQTQLLAAVE